MSIEWVLKMNCHVTIQLKKCRIGLNKFESRWLIISEQFKHILFFEFKTPIFAQNFEG